MGDAPKYLLPILSWVHINLFFKQNVFNILLVSANL